MILALKIVWIQCYKCFQILQVLFCFDRIFTVTLGLSQSLMVHEGTHNPNVTLKGYPKNFWGLFGQKAHKTQQFTLSQPQKGSLSLTLISHRQTYNPKCKPKCLPNENLGFSWDGCAYSMHNTAKFPDWLNSQNQVFSLLETMSSISQSLHDYSQPDFHHARPSHTYICHTSHVLWKNLQAYNIQGRVHSRKGHKFQRASRALGSV